MDAQRLHGGVKEFLDREVATRRDVIRTTPPPAIHGSRDYIDKVTDVDEVASRVHDKARLSRSASPYQLSGSLYDAAAWTTTSGACSSKMRPTRSVSAIDPSISVRRS